MSTFPLPNSHDAAPPSGPSWPHCGSSVQRLLRIVSLLIVCLPVVLGPTTVGHAAEATAPHIPSEAFTNNTRTVEALIAALEDEDLAAIMEHLADEAVLILPLSPDGDNATTNIHRFDGREAVRAALWRNLVAYKRIAFEDEVITPAADGRTIFVEARGEFETLHGRPYHNVYLIKLVFNEAGAITWIEEWTNPVTASMTWGFPLGTRTIPQVLVAGVMTGLLTAGGLAGVVLIAVRFVVGKRGGRSGPSQAACRRGQAMPAGRRPRGNTLHP